MNNLFKYLKKNKLLAVGFLILLICVGIAITAFHATFNSKTSSETGQTDTIVLPEPTVLIENENTVPKTSEESIPNEVTSAPTVAPTILPSIESDDSKYYYDLYSLNFIDEKNGWVVLWNYSGPAKDNTTSLLHTKDGGAKWESYALKDCMLQKVSFADSEIGWALALEGHPGLSDGDLVTYQILRTEDGGENWRIQMNCEAVYGEGCDIAVYGKGSACAILGDTIYRTDDSGKNWTQVESPVKDFAAEHIFFVDAEHGWISGMMESEVYILQTTDGGKNWSQQFSKDCGPERNETIGISFADEENGWFLVCNYGTYDGEVYHTSDGGNDWEKVSTLRVCRPYAQGVEAVTPEFLLIPMHHGAGPIDGGLYCSKDGGKNFTIIGAESGIYNSNGVEFVTSSMGWAIMNGYQEKYLMKTQDGGETWDKVLFEIN